MSSTGALSLERVPERMIVIGAGVIGLELVCVYVCVRTCVLCAYMCAYVCACVCLLLYLFINAGLSLVTVRIKCYCC